MTQGKVDMPGVIDTMATQDLPDNVDPLPLTTGSGDFTVVIQRLNDALRLNPNNYTLFSNRAAAYMGMGKYSNALADAKKVLELKPDWSKGHYRLGAALVGLERFEDALGAFAQGLAADPKQMSLLDALVEAMLKSSYRVNFQPKYEKFQRLKLDRNPFIVVSMVGQELLNGGRFGRAVQVLEAARKIGTDSPKLEASLHQALGQVYWNMNDTQKAIEYMRSDLNLNNKLADNIGICRARDNLAIALCSMGKYAEAIEHHTIQLTVAKNMNNLPEMYNASNRLARVYSKMNRFEQTLTHYKESLQLAKASQDHITMMECQANIGETYISMQEMDKAILWHQRHLQLARQSQSKEQLAEAYSNLGRAYHLKASYDQAMMFFQQLLSVAVNLKNSALKAKAYGGMGEANMAMGNMWYAQMCREQQLKLARELSDLEVEAIALRHLGLIHMNSGKLVQAMQFYQDSLVIVKTLKDRRAEGLAYADIGSCHVAMGSLREAVKLFEQHLVVCKELEDQCMQASTEGQLGLAHLDLGNRDIALDHLTHSVELAESLGDRSLQCEAQSNLGDYYTKCKDYQRALGPLDRAQKMATELKNHALESKICHNLGICHECLGNHQQAVQFFTHDLQVAKEAKDKEGVSRACEKLISAYTEIGDHEQAKVYKHQLINIARDFDHTSNKCALLNKMAEDMLNGGDLQKAIEFYEQLLKGAENEQHQSFKGQAYCGLGNTYMALGKPDRALSYYQQDLSIRKTTSDVTGECQAYANMGSAYNSMGQHQDALRCYVANHDLAKQLENPLLISKALSCLGIVHRNLGNYSEALHCHEQQLVVAQGLADDYQEQAVAHRNLGESNEAVGDHQCAIVHLSQYLNLVQKTKDSLGQIAAYSSLGRAHRGLGNYQQALQYFQNCMKLIKETEEEEQMLYCYADIATVHLKLGNFEQAIQAHLRQLELAQDLEDLETQSIAASALGEVYHCSGNYQEAIRYHRLDLTISRDLRSVQGQVRAFGNLADSCEAMEEYDKAIEHWEHQSEKATELHDDSSKARALTGLGIVNIKLEFYDKAISLLTQAWALVGELAEEVVEIKANILYNLGLAYFNTHDFNRTCASLQRSVGLFETLLQSGEMNCHATALVSKYSHLLQVLIHALVRQNKVEEALETSERERSRQVVEQMQYRNISLQTMRAAGLLRPTFPSIHDIESTVKGMGVPVVYYSIALGHLFTWLIHPQGGVVQFKQCDLMNLEFNFSDSQSLLSHCSTMSTSPLSDKISEVREGLGLPRQVFSVTSGTASVVSEDLDVGDEDSLSLGSADFLSTSGRGESSPRHSSLGEHRATSTPGLHRSRSIYSPPNIQPLQDLYSILIRPLDGVLPKPRNVSSPNAGPLVIIPDKDLFLVPYSLLRNDPNSPYLHQRFQLSIHLSLSSLIGNSPKSALSLANGSQVRLHSVSPDSHKGESPGRASPRVLHLKQEAASSRMRLSSSVSSNSGDSSHRHQTSSPRKRSVSPMIISQKMTTESLVVGNPTPPTNDIYLDSGIMYGSEKEAKIVGDILGTQPLIGEAASKDRVLRRLTNTDCCHFATGVSWNQSLIVLSSRGALNNGSESDLERCEGDGMGVGRRGVADGAASGTPEPIEYILSAEEILQTKMLAKLITISGCHRTKDPYLTSGGVISVVAAFLSAGAEAVLVPLWPTSNQTSRLMMSAFYSSLQYGSQASRALCYAMQTVANNKKYSHPIHWGGYVLIGKDVILKDRMPEASVALRNMFHVSEDYLIAGLKVLQSMITLTMKKITEGNPDPKYTSEQSLEQKMGPVPGWRELLKCAGFHFISQISRDVPNTVIFPEHDDSNMLRRCRKYIESMLNLPQGGLSSLQHLVKQPAVGKAVLAALHKATTSVEGGDLTMSTNIDSAAWMTKGCQEFFSALRYKVTLNSPQLVSVAVLAPARDQGQLLDAAYNATQALFGHLDYVSPTPSPVKKAEELSILC